MSERSKQEIEAGDWVAEGLGGKLFLSARLALEMFRRIRELEAERDALRADAERWRWARDKWQIQEAIDSIVGDDTVTINAMEVRIDAHIEAIAAKEPK